MSTANRFSALFKSPTDASTTKYTTDFPELGKESTNEATKDSIKESPNKVTKESTKESTNESIKESPKKSTKIILGHRSYEEELREQNTPYDEEEIMGRKSPYDILADKEKLAASLEKSRMCKSVDANELCQHGDKCRFAHSLAELKISNCLFDQRCHFVRISNGELVNVDSTKKICSHKHSHETFETFLQRTGLVRYRHVQRPTLPKVVVQPPPPFSPSQPPPPPSQSQFHLGWVTTQLSPDYMAQPKVEVERPKVEVERPKVEVERPKVEVEQPNVEVERSKVETKTQAVDNSDQILVIRVPKQLASQALEIAIKSGKSSVQIVIVD